MMNEATLKAGWGYWDVTQYPYGGDFRRNTQDTPIEVVQRDVQPGEHKCKMNNRTIVAKTEAIQEASEQMLRPGMKATAVDPYTHEPMEITLISFAGVVEADRELWNVKFGTDPGAFQQWVRFDSVKEAVAKGRKNPYREAMRNFGFRRLDEDEAAIPYDQVSEDDFIAGTLISYLDLNGNEATAQYNKYGRAGAPNLDINNGLMQPIMGEMAARSFFRNLGRRVEAVELSEEISEPEAEERILQWCRSNSYGNPAMRTSPDGTCYVALMTVREKDPNGKYDWQERNKQIASGRTWNEVAKQLGLTEAVNDSPIIDQLTSLGIPMYNIKSTPQNIAVSCTSESEAKNAMYVLLHSDQFTNLSVTPLGANRTGPFLVTASTKAALGEEKFRSDKYRIESEMTERGDGKFAVTLKDLDSGETLETVRIFDDQGKARDYARSLVKESEEGTIRITYGVRKTINGCTPWTADNDGTHYDVTAPIDSFDPDRDYAQALDVAKRAAQQLATRYIGDWNVSIQQVESKRLSGKRLAEDTMSAWADWCNQHGFGFDIFNRGMDILRDPAQEDNYRAKGFQALVDTLFAKSAWTMALGVGHAHA